MAKILIADDSSSIRLVLNDILSMSSHQIVGESENGEEAVSMFFKYNPDLLLLDLAMPKKDGLTVVTEIRKETPDAKIILITASDKEEAIKSCMEAGAMAYVSKPFDFKKVLEVIDKVL